MNINSINSTNFIERPLNTVRSPETKNNEVFNFSEVLNNAIKNTNDLQINAKKSTEDFALGKTDNIHSVLIDAEKAGIALQFTMQIRNKILDAYNEIMRINI